MTGLRRFLLVIGALIVLIGLFYGVPKPVLESAFGISIDQNALHIFRGVMGLYIGVGILVLLGSKCTQHTRFSLLLATLFFASLAAGRLISFVMDATMSRVAASAAMAEAVLFVVCLVGLTRQRKLQKSAQVNTDS